MKKAENRKKNRVLPRRTRKRGEKRVENEEKMYFSSKNRQVKKKRKNYRK